MDAAQATPDSPVAKRSKWFWFRVAVSVFFAVLTMALCLLWLRSYWRADQVFGRAGELLVFTSDNGYLRFSCIEGVNPRLLPESRWKRSATPASGFVPIAWYSSLRGETIVSVHYRWLASLAAAIVAVSVPIQKPHFSLRTLLIATTLVALVLGLAVWIVR